MNTPDTFGWVQVLREVDYFISQDLAPVTHRANLKQGGIPHWIEWGKDPWQDPITPVNALIPRFFASTNAETPGLQSFTSADPEIVPVAACAGDICKMNLVSWHFSSIELFYLAGLLKLPGLTGVKDPFFGCVEDDLKVYLKLARQALFQRGCLVVTSEGEQLDPALSSMLHTAATAAQVIIAVQNDTFMLVYLTPESIVLQQPLPEHQVGFCLLDSQTAVHSRLQSLLSLCQGPPAPGAEITVAQPVMEEARAMLADDPSPDQIASCAASLVQTGLSPESAAAFTLALARPISTGYMTILHRKASSIERQSGLAWLAGMSGIWIAGLPYSELPTTLTWRPASRHRVELAVDDLFARIAQLQGNQ